MADANLLLQQMQGCRAFILYRLIPQADGSLDKVPTSPATGYNCDHSDPAQWMMPDDAAMWANVFNAQPMPEGVAGYGVGLVISEQLIFGDGYRLFCLDLDKCRDGNQWLPYAASFCARFPGAFIECSVSGNGLHVFGLYKGERPDHSVKNKTYKIELYSRLRFIAVTGNGATGNIFTDHTRAFHALATELFPPKPEHEYGDTLTDQPVADWAGPADDDELIARMMRSTNARAIFGGKAAFADLWLGNAPTLARVFPAYKNTAWDESGADLALANHLAFWTGNHGTRMQRLMYRSALVRGKWERPGYLVGTINEACGSQTRWYKDPRSVVASPPPSLPVAAPAVTATPPVSGPVAMTDQGAALVMPNFTGVPVVPPAPGQRPPIGSYLIVPHQVELFAGCTYVEDVHMVMMPEGHLLTSERFDAHFAGYSYAVESDGQRPAKRAWEAFVHSQIHAFPKVKGVFFDPRKAPHSIETREGWPVINSWFPVEIPRLKGDPSPFIEHVRRILPRGWDADLLLAYFRACVQHPGNKFQYWPLIQGVEGNGKTILSELLEGAVGSRYTHWPKAAEVGSKFNAAFYGKILVCVEDVKISESKESLWETLKPMITGRKLEIESKGVDKVTREVCFNGVLNTNHKNGIRKTRNDRRIAPFFCAQQNERDLARDGLDENYFNRLRAWIADGGAMIVADWLLSEPIPDQMNPATVAIRAPRTSATEEAISAGLGGIEQEILEAIGQGEQGFRNGWVSSTQLDILLARMGKTTRIPRNQRRDLLEAVGYVPHPALPEGRSVVADADGSRPVLYVRKDAPGFSESDPGRVLTWYQHAQKT